MNKERIDALADGIFAIVMTLLVFDINVPDLHGITTNGRLWSALIELRPAFMSYVLSFSLLFTYWRAHNYLMSHYAKNIDVTLSNYNAIFFLFVALIPVSSHILGLYHETQLGVGVISLNTILIGLSLYFMRNYIIMSKTIDNVPFDSKNLRHGTIRTMIPVIFAIAAIPLSFADISSALVLLTLAVFFNIIPKSTDWVDMMFFRATLEREQNAKKRKKKVK